MEARTWRILMVLMITTTETESLTDYTCNNPGAASRIIDLTEPAPCADPEQDYEQPQTRTFQVLQTDASIMVEGYQCQITLTKEVTRCGFNSLAYGSTWPAWEMEIEITPQECRDAIKTGRVEVRGHTFVAEIGRLTTSIYFSHGAVDNNGNCQVASFNSEGIYYTNSYERTVTKILITVLRGTTNLADGTRTFEGSPTD